MTSIIQAGQRRASDYQAQKTERTSLIMGSVAGVIIGFAAGFGAMESNKPLPADWSSASLSVDVAGKSHKLTLR